MEKRDYCENDPTSVEKDGAESGTVERLEEDFERTKVRGSGEVG